LKLKSTFSAQDVLPSWFLKQIFDTIGPDLVIIINNCLLTGTIPEILKLASVSPIPKKASPDPSIYSNFRPISNLPFISKILEKIVFIQLQDYLTTNGISDIFQSGFKTLHSTETALLKVYNDILMSTDAGNIVALIMLDLSSAFDFVDHDVLLSRLEQCIGLRGTVLDWFRSFLSNRKFYVNIGNHSSTEAQVTCGVPQGSTLAPLLFSLYILPIVTCLSCLVLHLGVCCLVPCVFLSLYTPPILLSHYWFICPNCLFVSLLCLPLYLISLCSQYCAGSLSILPWFMFLVLEYLVSCRFSL